MERDRSRFKAAILRDSEGGAMFERLKRALVESFVGAIALGWLFAQAIEHVVWIFSSPVEGWVRQRELNLFPALRSGPTAFPFQNALPEIMKAALLLAICYVLIRWLYYVPLRRITLEPASEHHQQIEEAQ
jgi:hypothetical protein